MPGSGAPPALTKRFPARLLGRVGVRAQDDIDETLRLLRTMQEDASPHPLIRAYRPVPTVAFSRRESLMPEFASAAKAARQQGYEPVVRLAGGRAVAYDETCIVIDLLTPLDLYRSPIAAFDVVSRCFRDVLRDFGVEAHVGPVVGEYCAGEHSVNARGQVKLVGIAQRTMRDVRLVTASIVLESSERLRPVVNAVYATMRLDWSPESLGSLRDEGAQGEVAEIADELVTGLQHRHAAWALPQEAPLGGKHRQDSPIEKRR